jgi:transcriptional regulator with XRE-family HTH domain
MAVALPKPRYKPMAATMRRARTLLRMSQEELSEALQINRQSIGQIEQTRSYPSRCLVNRFAERFLVNLDVYDWARQPSSAESLPGLLGLVPLHIVRLYERRLVDASVRDGRSVPLHRKSSFDNLPSIF